MEIFRVNSLKKKQAIFFGAWEDAKLAWDGQLKLLKKGIHPSVKLQNHFNKFGADDMVLDEVINVKPGDVQKELMGLINKPIDEEVKKETEAVIETATMPEKKTEKAVVKKTYKRKK